MTKACFQSTCAGILVTILSLGKAVVAAESSTPLPHPFEWEQLASVPDREGFAGAFAGVSHGALVLAGGANITANQWSDNFVKTWYDGVFVLESPSGKWRKAGKLPRPMGYGVTVTADHGIICIGGSDSQRHYSEVVRLENGASDIITTTLPNLPKPCANGCGALVGKTIYIAGGIETPQSTVAMKMFWSLDLTATPLKWTELAPWPGPERMLGVAGTHGGSFYLFSGTRLHADPDGKPVREFLRDAYCYTPGKGWERLPDLPRAAVAAPSPAAGAGSSLYVISGDDGLNVDFKPVIEHPGFPRDVLAFDTATRRWSNAGVSPLSRATAPLVAWRGKIVVPNGEVRPRVRTPEVWAAELK